jgi:hypothetical protein
MIDVNGAMGRKMPCMFGMIDTKVRKMLAEAFAEGVTEKRQKQLITRVLAIAVGLVVGVVFLLLIGWTLLFG